MPIEIVMPKLGWTMEEGVLAEWIKRDGDKVNPGDILFTVESDKALQEVEAFDSGILHIPPDAPLVGSTVPVGGLLAYLVEPGEEIAPARVERTNALPAISPRAKRIAAELRVDWSKLTGSSRSGRIVERDVRMAVAAAKQPAVDITPVARRAAEELGVDLGVLVTQHPGKRITREDVERAASKPDVALAQETRKPISRVRKLIAERMSHSLQTTAPVTLTTEADATELAHLRSQLKAAGREPVPSYNDLFVKLISAALAEHPALNARIEGDEIVQSQAVHIGVAVDTERGLFVPVIRDVQNKSIRQIASESAVLIEAARAGTLTSEVMRGSTFSLTNLGMFEIDAFTPIINPPECAILGIGRLVPKQVVIDVEKSQVAIRQMMFLSLTFDHRVVDGAPAARFLQQVKRLVEQPYSWIID